MTTAETNSAMGTKPFVPPIIGPDPKADKVIGFIRAMVSNPISAMPTAVYSQPIAISNRTGKPSAFICDPAALEEILIKRPHDFPKSILDDRVLRPAFGDSLITAHNESWRWKRRLAAPYFTPAALKNRLPKMVKPFERLSEEIAKSDPSSPINISGRMMATTLEVIADALFTSSDELDMQAVSEAITDYLAPIPWTVSLASFRLPEWFPHPGRRKLLRGRDRMRKLVGDVITRRRQSKREYKDICADLMQARDPETGTVLSDKELIDMLLTLVVGGHETSAHGLTWALYCLAMQPEYQAKLRNEVREVVGDNSISHADLSKLEKTEAFLKESMRLFPPAPMMTRQASKPGQFGDHEIPQGMTLFIPIYAIHRHETLWKDPGVFDPSRFSRKNAREISRTSYMPFGAGPRICLGSSFSMMEMVAGLAEMVRKLEFSPASSTACDPISLITLRPRQPVELTIIAADKG